MCFALVMPRKRSLPRSIGVRPSMLVVNRLTPKKLCADAGSQTYCESILYLHQDSGKLWQVGTVDGKW
jgi:hypothetical protein